MYGGEYMSLIHIFYRHGKWISCPVTTSKVIEENEVTPYQNGTEKLLTLSTCCLLYTSIWGNPVYKRAVGGELKKDKEGNLILKADPAEEEKTPASETVSYHFRTAPYIKGEAEPDDLSLWDAALVPDYLTEQVMGMLGQLGYRQITEDGAPWAYIQIDPINGEAAGQILDWYTAVSYTHLLYKG